MRYSWLLLISEKASVKIKLNGGNKNQREIRQCLDFVTLSEEVRAPNW